MLGVPGIKSIGDTGVYRAQFPHFPHDNLVSSQADQGSGAVRAKRDQDAEMVAVLADKIYQPPGGQQIASPGIEKQADFFPPSDGLQVIVKNADNIGSDSGVKIFSVSCYITYYRRVQFFFDPGD
jgi:hypothetical protein